ncbi:hypothetical protein FACS189465_3630 [Clostridia bacterium]|nr:hypothetical protein FACS189465_3630 [Clostridia bacterium]
MHLSHVLRLSRENAEYIITRNEKDFKNSKIHAISPTDFLNLINRNRKE